MSEKYDGGPAFPQTWDSQGIIKSEAQELSLRDYFAAAALTGLIGKGWGATLEEIRADIAKRAYGYADAMLEARKK